jgi:hypothetical protein
LTSMQEVHRAFCESVQVPEHDPMRAQSDSRLLECAWMDIGQWHP